MDDKKNTEEKLILLRKNFNSGAKFLVPLYLHEYLYMFIKVDTDTNIMIGVCTFIYFLVYMTLSYGLHMLPNFINLIIRILWAYYNYPNIVDVVGIILFIWSWTRRTAERSIYPYHSPTMQLLTHYPGPETQTRSPIWDLISSLVDFFILFASMYLVQYFDESNTGIPKQYILLIYGFVWIMKKQSSFGANSTVGIALYAMLFIIFVLCFPEAGTRIGQSLKNIAEPFRSVPIPDQINSIPITSPKGFWTFIPGFSIITSSLALSPLMTITYTSTYILIFYVAMECLFGAGQFTSAQIKAKFPKVENMGDLILTIGDHRFLVLVFADFLTAICLSDTFRLLSIIIGCTLGYFVYNRWGVPAWNGAGLSAMSVEQNPGTTRFQPNQHNFNMFLSFLIMFNIFCLYSYVWIPYLLIFALLAIWSYNQENSDKLLTIILGAISWNPALTILGMFAANPMTQHLKSSRVSIDHNDIGIPQQIPSLGLSGA